MVEPSNNAEEEKKEKVEKEDQMQEDNSAYLDMTCSVCYESMSTIAQETKKQQNKEE